VFGDEKLIVSIFFKKMEGFQIFFVIPLELLVGPNTSPESIPNPNPNGFAFRMAVSCNL
jgi:hypothetical protein